jgi:UDP-2-acetamido-3-amino-2,3-dideoxy-glucuronate N-acetyltransferase
MIDKKTDLYLNNSTEAGTSTPVTRHPSPVTYFVHESSYVDENVQIGEGTKIWHFSHIQSGAVIGEKCSIGQNVNVGNNVKIGNGVKIQNNVSVYEGVELEDYVFCGPSMVFTNVLDPRSEFPQRGSDFYHKTLVKKSASIGANATIVCGNTIGRYAMIGAGSVVTKDVPDYALMIGVPAKQAGWVCECAQRLSFDEAGEAVCKKCGKTYVLEDARVRRK